MDDILISRTYDTVTILGIIADTVCPEFLEKDLQDLIEKCYNKLPARIELTLLEEEAPPCLK